MNTYEQLKSKHQKEMDAFSLGAAFSNKQFKEMMQKWGLTVDDTDKICSIGAGCFIRKTDKKPFLISLKVLETKRKPLLTQIRPATGSYTICSITNSQITNTALHTNTTKLSTLSA